MCSVVHLAGLRVRVVGAKGWLARVARACCAFVFSGGAGARVVAVCSSSPGGRHSCAGHTLDNAFELELLVHRELERYACGGEWYNISPLLAFGKLIDCAHMFSPDPRVTTVGPSEETKVGTRPIKIVKSKHQRT